MAELGYAGSGSNASAFAKVRVVTISECASHAVVAAGMGAIRGKGSGEQALARRLSARFGAGLVVDRGSELGRVKADLTLPVLRILADGSYSSVPVDPKIRGKARQQLLDAARGGAEPRPGPGPVGAGGGVHRARP